MEYLLKVSIVISIFYLFYILFLRNDTFFQFNRIFLLIGIPISFIIPFIVFNNYIEYTPVSTATYYQNLETITRLIATHSKETSFSIWQLLPILYFFGIVVFFLNFIVQFIGIFKIIHKSKNVKNNSFIVIETNKDVLPFSFFKWVVYNPNLFNKNELKQVLTHEKVHVKQYHSLDILTTKIVAVALWFNPFIWLYLKSVKQNLEFIADAGAQESLECKKTYQYTLLKTGFTQQQIAFTNNFFHSPIKKRIMMLQKRKSRKMNQLKYVFIIPILALFLMNFNTEDVYVDKTMTTNSLEKNNDITNENIIEIVFDKNTTLEKLEEKRRYLKENYNFDFDFEIENKDQKLADFKHSFNNGEQKHEATFLKVFPFSSINHSFILKYNIETKLLWIDAIVDGVTYDSTSKRYLDNNSIGFYIDDTDTDQTLKKYEKLMKEKGVDISFLDIKRNAKNRITEIRINAKTKNSKSSYNYKLDGKTYNGIAIGFYSNGNGLEIKPVLNMF